MPWLPEQAATLVRDYDPSGRIANLNVALQELDTEAPRYDLTMQFSDAGMLADERLPGLRGFSGSVRANRSGGRVEIDSAGLTC